MAICVEYKRYAQFFFPHFDNGREFILNCTIQQELL